MNRYNISNSAIIRSSNFSLSEFKLILDNLNSRKDLEKQIKKVLNNEKFMKALYIASENLFNSIVNFNDLNDKAKDKALISLIKYINRVCFRSTPFGMFSGISELNLIDSEQDNLNCINLISNKSKVEVSAEYLFEIYNDICNNLEGFLNAKVEVNPNIILENDYITLYIIGEHFNRIDNEKIYLKNNNIIKRIIYLLKENNNNNNLQFIINVIIKEFRVDLKKIISLLKKLLLERILLLECYPVSKSNNFFLQDVSFFKFK